MKNKVNSKERLEEIVCKYISKQSDKLFNVEVKQRAIHTICSTDVQDLYVLVRDVKDVELWHARYVEKKETKEIECLYNYDYMKINKEVMRINGHIAYRLCLQAKEEMSG